MKKKFVIFCALLLSALLLFACKPDPVEDGPADPEEQLESIPDDGEDVIYF
ncbi:MAG: hypothetical protein IK045_03530 [Bacteroidales bacterium]|nr:hypothetical protein [Bacteroidales bacterium]